MSTIKETPITWSVLRLLCDCGGEFEHKFSVKYADKPFTHVCNKCSAVEDMVDVYPKTIWREL
jgi:hypothetical protein